MSEMSTKDTIEIKEWYAPGGDMMYNCYGLDPTHEMHPYNQALAQGVRPEDFGIEHPYEEMFKDKTRGQLIHEVMSLRKELYELHRMSAMF